MTQTEHHDAPRWLPLLLIPVSLLSDPVAALPQLSYYFRDFTLTFYPLRFFAARELAGGHWPAWNPFVNEGTFVLPALYPADLLHVLWSGPAAVSWLLTMHLPLAALAFYGMARSLGASRFGASAGAAVYSLGGFALSCLNLYVFLEAFAWAPLVALGLFRCGIRGGRSIVVAAAFIAISFSTLALEFVAQGVLLGALLGLVTSGRRALPRVALALGLAIGLAAIPIALVVGILPETARGGGFPAEWALSFAAHPVALLQVILPGLFGSLSTLQHWWGGRFFTGGYPYFASLYLGPLALGTAAAGIPALQPTHRRVVLGVGGLGLWYALGSSAGLSPVLVSLPVFRWFRFPSKALLLPYLAICLFVAFGAERLRRGEGWQRVATVGAIALALGIMVALPVLIAPEAVGEWLALSPEVGADMSRAVPLTCARAVALAGLVLALAFAVRRGRVAPARGATLLVALTVADLALAGAGMNPQVSREFFEPLPEIRALGLDQLDGGRVFSYGVKESPAFRPFLEARRPGTGLWSFFVNRQTLFPFNNIVDRVETAEGLDRTSFLANPPLLSEAAYDPGAVASVLPVLRGAAVSRVVSIDPLSHPDLRLLAEAPAGPPGLAIRVYEVLDPWPRSYVACHVILEQNRLRALTLPLTPGFDPRRDVVLEEAARSDCREGRVAMRGGQAAEQTYDVVTDGPGYLVARDSFARGWTARVDRAPTPVLRANGKHRAVAVPEGRHQVVLTYRPPGLRVGIAAATLAALTTLALWRWPVLNAPTSTDPGRATS